MKTRNEQTISKKVLNVKLKSKILQWRAAMNIVTAG
jgi:hypothetical protein